MSATRIWLCADDYGISPAVNRAIRDLVGRGRLNATSVMVGTPSFSQAEADALKALDADSRRVAIGLHVTLTAPFTPLSTGYGPLDDGKFLPIGRMFVAAFLRRLRPEALQREIARQADAFKAAFGRPPDFLDGHQHVHLLPQVRDAFLAVAAQAAPNAWVRQCGQHARRLADLKGLVLDRLSGRFRARAARQGVRTNPAFAGTYDFRADADFAALFPRFLDGLPQGSVVMCHPGFVDAELTRLDPLTTLREREYAYLAGETFPRLLAERGMTLA